MRPVRFVQVLRADELTPTLHPATVGDTPILLTRLANGDPIAFAAHCPHQGTALQKGRVDGTVIFCPQHHYRYDMTTGHNVWPSNSFDSNILFRMKPGYLRTFAVQQRDEWLWVATKPDPAPQPAAPNSDANAPVAAAPGPPRPPIAVRPPMVAPQPVAHPEEVVMTNAGAELQLELPTQAAPGHLWAIEVEHPQLVAVQGQTFQPGRPGTPDQYLVRLLASSPGEVMVTCTYRRPWGGVARETRTFRVQISSAAAQ